MEKERKSFLMSIKEKPSNFMKLVVMAKHTYTHHTISPTQPILFF